MNDILTLWEYRSIWGNVFNFTSIEVWAHDSMGPDMTAGELAHLKGITNDVEGIFVDIIIVDRTSRVVQATTPSNFLGCLRCMDNPEKFSQFHTSMVQYT